MFEHAIQLLKQTSVASIAPTSRYCSRQLLRSINFHTAKVIIEYGPGDGAITKLLLQKMGRHSKLILVETNDYFISVLNQKFTDPRVTIVHDSAENILNILNSLQLRKADYIISGIPFSMISKPATGKIVRDSSKVLKARGKMIVYQALTAVAARRPLKNLFMQFFKTSKARSYLLNLPPLYAFEAQIKSKYK